MTQYELGDRSGADGRTIGRIETDRVQPQTRTINNIADALNVPVRWLYEENYLSDSDCRTLMSAVNRQKRIYEESLARYEDEKSKGDKGDQDLLERIGMTIDHADEELTALLDNPEGYIYMVKSHENADVYTYRRAVHKSVASMYGALNEEGRTIVREVIEVLLKHDSMIDTDGDENK